MSSDLAENYKTYAIQVRDSSGDRLDGVIKFGYILCHYKMEMKAKQTLTLSEVHRHLSYP